MRRLLWIVILGLLVLVLALPATAAKRLTVGDVHDMAFEMGVVTIRGSSR